MVKVIHNRSLYLLILVGLLFPASNAFADGNTTDFNITVNPSLSLSVSSANVGFEITPTQAGTYNSANFTVTSSTNNSTGYTLLMTTNNANLTSNVINPNTGTNPTIPTLNEVQDITAAQFEAHTSSAVLNHYGVAIGENSTFNAMELSNEVESTDTNNTSGADETIISLASKLDLNTVPGTYSTTLTFQMTANPLPDTLETAYAKANKQKTTIGGQQYYSMQDMSSVICEDVDVIDDKLQVYDNRDNKIYWIAKLADGHCWMTQNLDLDLVHMTNDADALYTHANTDLGWGSDTATNSWNPERSTFPVTDTIHGYVESWIDSENDPYSVDTGDWYWTDVWHASYPYTYIDGHEDDKFSQTQYTNNGMHGHVGNHYSWTAAIASNDSSGYTSSTYNDISDNPQNSICPAGWRLPTIYGGNDYPRNDEFIYLLDYYDAYITSGNERDRALAASPLWFVRGGYVYAGSLDTSGFHGSYWSSTVHDEDEAYSMDFESNNLYEDASYKGYGRYIRCVAR